MSDERSPESAESSAPQVGAAGIDRAKLIEQRLQEVLAAYKELKAENDSFRQRTRRNAERRFEERQEQFVLKFMDILDNFDRALDAAQVSYAGNPLIQGLILVRTQILQTLQDEGLEWIPVVGRPYDPEVAEAVATETVDDPERHHIVIKDEMRGYRLNGRLARAARVVVGKYEGPEAVAAPAGDALTAAVLEAASATDEEIRGEPDEVIDADAEVVPDRHTIANLADAAAEAVAAADEETSRRMAAAAAEAVTAPEPRTDAGEEFSDTVVDAGVGVTDSGAFEIEEEDDETGGLDDFIQAAAEAVEDETPPAATGDEAEPPPPPEDGPPEEEPSS